MRLKCDLHIHTKEDPRHQLNYTAEELIDRAAEKGYQVISITNHNIVTYSERLAQYASTRGILLIPGVEATVMGKHVLIYGVDKMDTKWDRMTFFDLKRVRADGAFVVAPHPFYPNYNCIGTLLERFSSLFDAVEYSHLYTKKVNFNHKAQSFASKNNLPILGLSDAHSLKQLDYTFTVIESDPDQESIFAAIRGRKTSIVTRPAKIYTSSLVGLQLFGTFLMLHLFR